MIRKLKVVYSGTLNSELDRNIRMFMESLGITWYAQGYNWERQERDICFDLPDQAQDFKEEINEKSLSDI